jgi:hypothetical protein
VEVGALVVGFVTCLATGKDDRGSAARAVTPGSEHVYTVDAARGRGAIVRRGLLEGATAACHGLALTLLARRYC